MEVSPPNKQKARFPFPAPHYNSNNVFEETRLFYYFSEKSNSMVVGNEAQWQKSDLCSGSNAPELEEKYNLLQHTNLKNGTDDSVQNFRFLLYQNTSTEIQDGTHSLPPSFLVDNARKQQLQALNYLPTMDLTKQH